MGVRALAERVRAGDRDAIAEMYGDYADRVFGLCVVLLRDREEAADALQDTFVLAVQRVGQLRDPERLDAWLFAIARRVCFRRLNRRARVAPVDTPPDVVVLDEDPDAELAAADASALVWAAAVGLSDRDRAVLYLNTREGLEGRELTAALGLQHANPYSVLNRAKAQLERAIGVLLVARANRRICPELSGVLAGWDGTLTPLLRKRIGRHLDDCALCQQTKSRASRLAMLAVAPVAPVSLLKPARAAALTADDITQIAARRPVAPERWQRDGFPPVPEKRARRRGLLVSAALILLLVVVLGEATMSAATKDPHHAPAPRARVVARVRHQRHPVPTPVSTTRAPTTPTTIVHAVAPTVPMTPATSARPAAPPVTMPPVVVHPTVPPTTVARTTVPPATTTTVPKTTTLPGT